MSEKITCFSTHLLNCPCVRTKPSNRIGNLTSQLPTIFCILKSRNLACNKPLNVRFVLHQLWWAANGRAYRKSQLLNDSRVLSSSQSWIFFAFRARTHHFPGTENESGRSRFSYSHNDSGEPFGIVFGISGVKSNLFEIKFTTEIHRWYDISANDTRWLRMSNKDKKPFSERLLRFTDCNCGITDGSVEAGVIGVAGVSTLFHAELLISIEWFGVFESK